MGGLSRRISRGPLQRHLVWEQQWTPGYAPVRAGLKRTFKRLLVTEETVANRRLNVRLRERNADGQARVFCPREFSILCSSQHINVNT